VCSVFTQGGKNNYAGYGLVFRESGTGKLVTLHLESNSYASAGNGYFRAIKMSSPTTTVASYLDTLLIPLSSAPIYFRIADDGTNQISSISTDGQNWLQLHSVSRTDYLTGGANQVGVYFNTGNNWAVNAHLISWAQG